MHQDCDVCRLAGGVASQRCLLQDLFRVDYLWQTICCVIRFVLCLFLNTMIGLQGTFEQFFCLCDLILFQRLDCYSYHAWLPKDRVLVNPPESLCLLNALPFLSHSVSSNDTLLLLLLLFIFVTLQTFSYSLRA